jgi:hypothetical protein
MADEFDLLSALADKPSATDFTVVHFDAQAVYDYQMFDAQLNSIYDSEDARLPVIEERLNEARTRVEASAFEIHVQPISEVDRDEIVKVLNSEFNIDGDDRTIADLSDESANAYGEELELRVMTAAVTKVVKVSTGETDSNITIEKVRRIRQLPPGYYNSIVELYGKLTLKDYVYKQNVLDVNF